MASEGELYSAWADGDAAAGRELFARFYPVVSRFFANKVATEAPELVQETFVRCLDARHRFSGDVPFRAFVLGVARKVLFKHLRKRYRGDATDFNVESLAQLGTSPTTAFTRKEQERRLLLALRMLPVEQQILLEMYFWEGMQGPELARVYDVPEGTVRSRLLAARQTLQAEFDALGRTHGPFHSSVGKLDAWAASVRERLES